MKRLIPIGWALALVLAACAGSRDEITEEFLPPTDPTTTTATVAPGSTTTTTLPIDLEQSIALLLDQVREIRRIDASLPTIEYLPAADVEAAYRALHGLPGTGDERFDSAYLRMLGVLEADATIADLQDPCVVPGYYDATSGRLIIKDGLDDLTPLERRHLAAEMTVAATDEEHGWGATLEAARRTGDIEAAAALWGLVQGDAAFHADQYVEQALNQTDRFAITLEQISCQQRRATPPGFVAEHEAYGPEVGRAFVEDLVSTGGIPAVDAAYQRRPVSSEQIYHPARFAAGEGVAATDLPALSVAGFTEADAGTFGERGFRAILSEGVSSAQALQAATGWGGDAYRVLWNGTDVVLVVAFEGDEARDARELAETLGGWASASLGVGAGRPDNTGLAFEGEDYAFVAHDDTSMLLVVSNDAGVGRDVRNVFWPAW